MLHVTCAVIERFGKILLCQRSVSMHSPLKWEFPGGKIEINESKKDCLIREIREELQLDIVVGQALATVTHEYPTFTIHLYPFLCEVVAGDLRLTEHAQALWVSPNELMNYDLAEADIPIVQELRIRYAK